MISIMASHSTVCVLAGGRADVTPKCHFCSVTSGSRGLAPSWALSSVIVALDLQAASELLQALVGFKCCISGHSCKTVG